MRGFRLNGWQRIGIVTSVAWAIGAWFYTAISFEKQATSEYLSTHEMCVTPLIEQGRTHAIADCTNLAREARSLAVLHKSETAAFNAFVPILIAWLIVYGVIGLIRWVRRGFQPAG
jgi:hypothetical protein